MAGYKASILSHYTLQRKRLREDTSMTIGKLLRGYKRQVAGFKQTNEMPIQEGKRPLTFNAYRYLANFAFKSTDFGATTSSPLDLHN